MTRRDPLGKRALFETPPVGRKEPAGEEAAGSDPSDGTDALYSVGPHRRGTVVFACSECGVRSRMSAIEAGVRIAFFSAWIPGRRYNRWVQCPECERRTWSRIHWFG